MKLPDINNKNALKDYKEKEKDKNIITNKDKKKCLTIDDQLWSFFCSKNISKQLKKSLIKNSDLSNSIASINA